MRRLFLSFALCASFAPAQTLVTGGGAALQIAIDVAAAGDTLIVSAGTYSPIEVRKALTIVCEPNVTLTGSGPSVVAVNNLPRGETFVLRGARITAAQLTSSCFLSNCAGVIVLDSVIGISSSGCTILSCEQVALHGMRESRVSISSSTVTLVDCEARVTGSGSRVSLSGLTVSTGVSGFFDVYLSNCESFVTGDGATALGFLVSGGTLHVDPRVQASGSVSIQNNGVVLSEEIPTVTATEFVPGATATVSTSFGVGQFGALVLGLPSPVVPTPIGDYWGGATLLTLRSGTPASGVLTATLPIPAYLARGERYVMHGIALDLSALPRIGPALVTVVP